jgi:uncharacterized protein HemX
MKISLNGDGMALSTAVRIAMVFAVALLAFGALQAQVVALASEAEANSAQNEFDKRTAVIVQHQQAQIDMMTDISRETLETLADLRGHVASLDTKLDERTNR